MKNLSFIIFFCFAMHICKAQQEHFIYLQTEIKQPFYVRLNDKVLSSSASGYLIISKLSEGVYNFIIGFPKKEWNEQQLSCRVDKKDVGYLLKNFGEKGWGLFNMQTLSVTMPGNASVKNEIVPSQKSDDAFSTTLANVVNDSSILQKDIVKEKPKEKPVEIKIDNPADQINAPQVNTPKTAIPETNIPQTTSVTSIITRKLKKNNKNGMDLLYVDEYENTKDTIRIFIPSDKIKIEKESDSTIVKAVNTVSTDVVNTDSSKKEVTEKINDVQRKAEQNNDDKKFIDFDKTITKKDNKNEQPVIKSSMINSDCKGYAGEDDFIKLRKKMAAEKNDDDMVRVAKKIFKTKCFTTEYIKNLSALFLKDEGKYMFFDAAYPYVSDSDIFYTLENQLTDSYYINRFKAMLHK